MRHKQADASPQQCQHPGQTLPTRALGQHQVRHPWACTGMNATCAQGGCTRTIPVGPQHSRPIKTAGEEKRLYTM